MADLKRYWCGVQAVRLACEKLRKSLEPLVAKLDAQDATWTRLIASLQGDMEGFTPSKVIFGALLQNGFHGITRHGLHIPRAGTYFIELANAVESDPEQQRDPITAYFEAL